MNSSLAPDSFFRRFDLVLLVLAGLLTAALYTWCLSPDLPDTKVRHRAHRYFAWQAEAWLAGRLDLPRTVPPGLLALPDPYDPVANEPFRFGGAEGVHDLSLYKGKLYLYWGPVPALVAFLPWRILTGEMLPSAWASWAFAMGGWLAAALLLARAARNYFPATPRAVLFAGFVSLGVCSWAPVVLRRASVWETPIFAACCFGALAWWLLAECVWASRTAQWRWLAAASLAWGFTVGARPVWIIGAGVLLVPLWLARDRWRETDFRRLALAATAPFTVCVLALLAYNAARFDHPLEFGQHWQLAGARVQEARLFSATYAGFNLREYLFSVPQAAAYFPFVLPPAPTMPPTGHFGTELVYGLFMTLPWLWLGALVPFGGRMGAAAAPAALTAAALLAVLAGFAGVTARYEMEIGTPFATLAALGLLVWEARATRRPWLRRTAWFAALTAAAIITLAINCQFMGMFALHYPAEYERLARVANRFAVTLGWSPADAVQAVELTVIFPAGAQPGRQETLVSSGRERLVDGLFVEYLDSKRLRFTFFHGSDGGSTQPLQLDLTTPHRLRIEFGGMLPPATHPFWRNTAPAEIGQRRSQLRLTIDGLDISTGQGPQFEPVYARPEIGALPVGVVDRYVFTGKILEQRLIRIPAP